MSSDDEPRGKVLPFKRPRKRGPLPPREPDCASVVQSAMRLAWRELDAWKTVLDAIDLDECLAWADEAIAQGLAEGHEARADVLNVRAFRSLVAGDADAALAAWDALVAEYPSNLAAHVMRARFHERRGDDAAATADFDRAVELAPTDPAGYLRRAAYYEAKGDGPRALANFRRAVQLDPSSDEALYGLARRLAAEGDAKGATRVYAKAAEQELGDAEDYKLRGFMHFVANQRELALADYEAALALAPNDPEAMRWRALCRLMLHQFDQAFADFTRLIALLPSDAFGYWRRGEALVHLGRPTQALADLERAIELGPDERGAAHFLRGNAQQALGDIEAALASYDVAIERDPSNAVMRLRRFQIYNEAGNWQRCQIDADALLGIMPDDPHILLGHARLCARNGRRNDARADYDRLIALQPEHAHAHHERAELYVGEGDTMKAVAGFARAFELAPDDPQIVADHGRYQMMCAETPEAREAAVRFLERSVELDKDNPEAWARAAGHFRGTGRGAEAAAYLTRALELDPDNVDYLSERAEALRQAAPFAGTDPAGFQSQVALALADIERAIALAPEDDLELYRTRADLREDMGDLEGAIADHTKMIELDPDFIDAYMGRATLRKRTGDMAGALADAAQVRVMEDAWREEMAAHVDVSKVARFDLDTA